MNRTRTPLRQQGGFTLLEIIFAVFILGLMSLALGPSFRSFITAKEQQYKVEQTSINSKIAAAMLQFAEQGPANAGYAIGSLTPPCNNSTNKIFFAIYNSSLCGLTTNLQPYLQQQGVPMEKVNNDGTANQNVRVYQRLSSLSQNSYLFYQSGPQVYLNYDYGVVYLTNCGAAQACNTGASSSTPPASSWPGEAGSGAVKLTTTNVTTWTPGIRDVGAAYVSTLPLQKKFLQTTADQIDRLRTSFINFFAAQQAATPAATTNFYPQPTDVARRLPANDPTLNQGCREGWYPLDDPTMDILAQIGMGGGIEYGRTAWGASIEYCRDYDPTYTSGYGVAPHFAALRINRSVSLSLPPDSSSTGGPQNVIVSF